MAVSLGDQLVSGVSATVILEFVVAWASRVAISGVVATTISAPAAVVPGVAGRRRGRLGRAGLPASVGVLVAAYRSMWSPTRSSALISASSIRNG